MVIDFIRREILEIKELDPVEKVLLQLIYNFTNKYGSCDASLETISEWIGLNDINTDKHLLKLQKLGCIELNTVRLEQKHAVSKRIVTGKLKLHYTKENDGWSYISFQNIDRWYKELYGDHIKWNRIFIIAYYGFKVSNDGWCKESLRDVSATLNISIDTIREVRKQLLDHNILMINEFGDLTAYDPSRIGFKYNCRE